MRRSTLALLAGPLVFVVLAFAPLFPDMDLSTRLALGITAWMAIWWISEVVHVTVTALLPLVLFPLCGILPLKTAAAEFGNEIIFLFLSGLLFGQAIERWNLHTRTALTLVRWMGNRPARIVLGFMMATAFLSMWISNTATAVMMMPVAVAVSSSQLEGHALGGGANFRKALMLGLAYACSIGGVATLIGTPTNAVFLSYVKNELHLDVSFWQWFVFAFPFAVLLLTLCWWLLMRIYPQRSETLDARSYREVLEAYLARLGPVTSAERRLMTLFGTVIVCWLTGSLLWYRYVPNSNDVVVAVAGALLLFVLPAGERGTNRRLLDWSEASRIPWGVLFFFGGGLALARGFEASGLAGWLGSRMSGLSEWHPLLIALVVFAVVSFISEIASNVATASMMMPVLAALAQAVDIDPFGLLLGAAIAASFGFALPVATAPNTIVFSSGYLNTRDMVRAGLWLDIVAVLLLLGFAYFALPLVWGLSLGR